MKEFQGDASLGLAPALHCPARLDEATAARVKAVALQAHRALGCVDFSRTDIRLRSDGTPFVLEVNPLPGLSPLDSNFPVMTSAAGLSHAALIQRIVELAMARYRQACPPAPAGPSTGLAPYGVGRVAGGEDDVRERKRTRRPREPLTPVGLR